MAEMLPRTQNNRNKKKMTFIETFTAVFIATFMAQISVWLIDRYIKKHLNKGADSLEALLKQKKRE